ncbi:MAG: aspartate carbamoyltransferase [Clostridiales Family XIII bacterium]|jgi:aspartate carbamoyltransferase catalytic subunit|nr:aspartate carbamoyltransferase [Clostridiales Family XIII bacterium]
MAKGDAMTLTGRNFIEPPDFTVEEIHELIGFAERIMAAPGGYAERAKGRLLATLFYEPSTRTRFSFEAAMLKLGGQVIGFSGEQSSSAAKGESISDTIRTVACYADIAVIRHPKEGSAKVAAAAADIPVINGGDGGHQHPTQTLTDLMTIKSEKGRLSNLKVGLCGDLKFGRTVHSLARALCRESGIEFILISPEELRVPDYVKLDIGRGNGSTFREAERMQDVIGELDVLYMTRVQRERFFNEEDYIRLKDSYILDAGKMELAPQDMIVMHPLPRVNEIATEVDADPRAVYFKQARNGMYARMALILSLLGIE